MLRTAWSVVRLDESGLAVAELDRQGRSEGQRGHFCPCHRLSPLVDDPGAGRQNSRVTNLIDMGDREYFAQFAKRPGMFIGSTSLSGVTAFMVGYDQAARRHGGPGLDGWREWLTANYQVGSNLVWEAQIRQVALPDVEGGRDLTPEQEAHVLKVLFGLLDQFLSQRDVAGSGS